MTDKSENIIVYSDKAMLKIHGLKIKGLNPRELEEILTKKLQSVVRVIGVTGESVDMDVYGFDVENIKKNEGGIIRAISLAEGITATEVAHIAYAEKIISVDFNTISDKTPGCAKQRWMYENK